jgi:hypothetical protein
MFGQAILLLRRQFQYPERLSVVDPDLGDAQARLDAFAIEQAA